MGIINGLSIVQTLGMAIGISVVGMGLSYLLSLKIMGNKEF